MGQNRAYQGKIRQIVENTHFRHFRFFRRFRGKYEILSAFIMSPRNQNNFQKKPEKHSQKEPQIFDFRAKAVSPHSEGRKIIDFRPIKHKALGSRKPADFRRFRPISGKNGKMQKCHFIHDSHSKSQKNSQKSRFSGISRAKRQCLEKAGISGTSSEISVNLGITQLTYPKISMLHSYMARKLRKKQEIQACFGAARQIPSNFIALDNFLSKQQKQQFLFFRGHNSSKIAEIEPK